MAPVQVRISGAADDVKRLAEFLAAIARDKRQPGRDQGEAVRHRARLPHRQPRKPMTMHATSENIPNGPGLFEVNGHDPNQRLITNVRKIVGRSPRPAGSVLVGASTVLLALLGAGCFYVSWWGQYLFIFAAKTQQVPAMIQAGMLDAGMVILSGLSLGLARQGKSARAERVLIQLCAFGSAAMNYLAADDASPRSVIVFTAAPVFAAIITDRVVSVVRRHALGISEESAWRSLGRAVAGGFRIAGMLALYWLRIRARAAGDARAACGAWCLTPRRCRAW